MSEQLLTEIASSVRMLLRHAMTAPQGAGTPSGELFSQIRKLDKAMGKPTHEKEPKWVPPKKTSHNHVDTEQAFSRPVPPPDPKPEPPTNGQAKPHPKPSKKSKDPVLVLKNGKWSLKK